MAVLKRRQGVRNRRETDGIMKSFKAVKTVHEALEIVCELYVTENYRDRTINDYRKYWAEFTEVVGIMPSDNVTVITEDHLRSYITTMLNIRDLSPVTINIRLGGIKSILSRMTKRGLLNENPAKRVTKLRVDEKTIKMLTDSQVRRFFKMIDKDTFPGFRDYVAFLIALKCGLRSNELEGLKPEDIDFDNLVIMLPGAVNKNRKNRMVPMTEQVAEEMRQLLTEMTEYFGTFTHVFVNQYGEKIAKDHLRKRAAKYGEMADLKKECRPSLHSLRHSFAINYLRNGGDIRSLQKIMGHADLASTEIYLDYVDDIVIEQYRKASRNDTLKI
ncbi:tyrosine-type recombinase/integrase [Bacillus velezensis]|uniref:tyrosine-type recombinase/integrase n=1 Tax=Bacillus velezensis TaxID=492670 RepID=UPI001BDA56C9|nr:tyrosine-type recombinase/integrase [Bacillus velezensis]MBT0952069.1 tyrosine-type recombinase/integrase [Bacillus velezensis]